MEYVPLAAIVAGIGALVGIRRCRLATGHVDPTHPLLFPSVYVAVATLAPTVWVFGFQRNLGYIRLHDLSPHTPKLMAFAVFGFTLGAAIAFPRRDLPPIPRDPATLRLAGHLFFLLPLGLAVYGYATDHVLVRGENQGGPRGIYDSIDVAGFILAPAAVILIASGRAHLPKPFSKGELLAALTLITLLGLEGRRGSAIAVVLAVAFAYSRRRARFSAMPVLLGTAALLAFAYAVSVYRTAAVGGHTKVGAPEVLLRDLGSIPFTSGVTARLESNLGGSSIKAGLLHQLPGPVTTRLFGQVSDTGALIFRHIYPTPDTQGYGYSIPAEGILNYGARGAFLLPFVLGLIFAWLYARSDFNATRARQLAYFMAAATLPFAWRSDVLGAVKGVLYPVVLIWVVIVYARTVHRWVTNDPRLGVAGRAHHRRNPTVTGR